MWISTTRGFYSAIQWHDGRMCIRARAPGDLERLQELAPTLDIAEITPHKDYRYRGFLSRADFESLLIALAREITYGNFKSAAAKTVPKHEVLYHDVWDIMSKLQPTGPYGNRVKGYPPVPENEQKAQVEADKGWTNERWVSTGVGSHNGDKLTLDLDSTAQGELDLRLGDDSDDVLEVEGLIECEECGHPGEADDMYLLAEGVWVCGDATECIRRCGINPDDPLLDRDLIPFD